MLGLGITSALARLSGNDTIALDADHGWRKRSTWIKDILCVIQIANILNYHRPDYLKQLVVNLSRSKNRTSAIQH